MAKDYPFIRLWGLRMGSLGYYIDGQVERAQATDAPEDALYEKHASDGSGRTGTWCTMTELAVSNPGLHADLTHQHEERQRDRARREKR